MSDYRWFECSVPQRKASAHLVCTSVGALFEPPNEILRVWQASERLQNSTLSVPRLPEQGNERHRSAVCRVDEMTGISEKREISKQQLFERER